MKQGKGCFSGRTSEMRRDHSSSGQQPEDTRSAHVKAMDRVSQIISICLCFAIPVIGGYYLDQWLGTRILFTVLCLLFGMVAAGVQFRRLLTSLNREALESQEKFRNKS